MQEVLWPMVASKHFCLLKKKCTLTGEKDTLNIEELELPARRT